MRGTCLETAAGSRQTPILGARLAMSAQVARIRLATGVVRLMATVLMLRPARIRGGLAHERGDSHRQDRPSPAAGAGEFGRDPRSPVGPGQFARDLHGLAPARDGFQAERPGLAPAADEYPRDRRGSTQERDGQRPEPDRFPAAPGGFRTDWEVLRAVRDGLRAEGDAAPEVADRFGRDGLRPDVPPRPAAGYGRPDATSGQRTPERDTWTGAGRSPVPRASDTPSSLDDDTLTKPLPVILPGATSLPRPGPVEAPRGPFEPARPSQPQSRPASITGSVEPPAETFAASALPPAGPPLRPIPEAAAAKLDQIKDLYLTAEAIGEDALDRHFDQVSQRQRELIREFFDRSGPGTEASAVGLISRLRAA